VTRWGEATAPRESQATDRCQAPKTKTYVHELQAHSPVGILEHMEGRGAKPQPHAIPFFHYNLAIRNVTLVLLLLSKIPQRCQPMTPVRQTLPGYFLPVQVRGS